MPALLLSFCLLFFHLWFVQPHGNLDALLTGAENGVGPRLRDDWVNLRLQHSSCSSSLIWRWDGFPAAQNLGPSPLFPWQHHYFALGVGGSGDQARSLTRGQLWYWEGTGWKQVVSSPQRHFILVEQNYSFKKRQKIARAHSLIIICT